MMVVMTVMFLSLEKGKSKETSENEKREGLGESLVCYLSYFYC